MRDHHPPSSNLNRIMQLARCPLSNARTGQRATASHHGRHGHATHTHTRPWAAGGAEAVGAVRTAQADTPPLHPGSRYSTSVARSPSSAPGPARRNSTATRPAPVTGTGILAAPLLQVQVQVQVQVRAGGPSRLMPLLPRHHASYVKSRAAHHPPLSLLLSLAHTPRPPLPATLLTLL